MTAELELLVRMVNLVNLVMMAPQDQWEMSAKSANPADVACPVMLAKRVFPVKMVSQAKAEMLVHKERKVNIIIIYRILKNN